MARITGRDGTAAITIDATAYTDVVTEAHVDEVYPQEPVVTFGSESDPEYDAGAPTRRLIVRGFFDDTLPFIGEEIIAADTLLTFKTAKTIAGDINKTSMRASRIAGRGAFFELVGQYTGALTVSTGA